MPDDTGNVRFLPPRETRPATPAMDFSDRLKVAGLRAEVAMCVLHITSSTEALAHTGSDVDRRSAAQAIHRAQEALAEMALLLTPPAPDGLRAQLEASVAALGDEPEPPQAA
jgi:hypothetical protein